MWRVVFRNLSIYSYYYYSIAVRWTSVSHFSIWIIGMFITYREQVKTTHKVTSVVRLPLVLNIKYLLTSFLDHISSLNRVPVVKYSIFHYNRFSKPVSCTRIYITDLILLLFFIYLKCLSHRLPVLNTWIVSNSLEEVNLII